MKKNKYLKLFIAAFLALGFIGVVNAETAQDKNLKDAVIKSVEKVSEIMKSPDSVEMKEIRLNEVPQQISNVQVSGSSESTKDALEKQFKEVIIKKMIEDLKNNPKAAKTIGEKIKGSTVAQELEKQFPQQSLELKYKMSGAKEMTPAEKEALDKKIKEMFTRMMNQSN